VKDKTIKFTGEGVNSPVKLHEELGKPGKCQKFEPDEFFRLRLELLRLLQKEI
jgi:hypothetical protein